MNKTFLAVAVVTTIFAGQALAANVPNFDYAQLSFLSTDNDDYANNANGFKVEYSQSFGENNLFVYADAFRTTMSNNDVVISDFTHTAITAQLGYKYGLNDKTVAYARGGLGYYKADMDIALNGQGFISGSSSSSVVVAAVGIRYALLDTLEFDGNVNYVKGSDLSGQTEIILGAKYFISDAFSVGAGVTFTDYATSYTIGAGYHF